MAYFSARSAVVQYAAASLLLGVSGACSLIVSADGLQGDTSDAIADAAVRDGAAPDARMPIDATYTDTAQDVRTDGTAPTDGPPDAASDAAHDATADSGSSAYPCGNDGSGEPAAPLGEYATWQGKVNVHRTFGGAWTVDSDCSSGATVNTITYCRKFWSTTAQQLTVSTSPELKPFTSGGGTAPTCGGVAMLGANPAVTQFACCPTVR